MSPRGITSTHVPLEIDLVVACSKRKRGPTAVAFRSLPRAVSAALLAEAWLRRVQAEAASQLVGELYTGRGWHLALAALAAIGTDRSCRLRVISAGFGLLSLDDLLPVYSASFTRHPDRVADRLVPQGTVRERHQAWWAAINAARHLGPSPLRDLQGDLCLVVAGSTYLEAVEADLLGRVRQRGPDSLLLVCAGQSADRLPASLRPCLLPIEGSSRSVVGGPMHTLNPRALLWLLHTVVPRVGWDRELLRRAVGVSVNPIHPPGEGL